ncbi:hypothetical protein R1sor_003755 [Riccia sorocarpa]|uniref:Reverse transcriptase zinc-binding domain-containing protein n=1 Tax=Riccia sorocarpa TaxID=122646 RepID=A0ABD3H3B2_9MARC
MEFEVQAGNVEGIYLQPANIHYSLGFFADDSHVIFRATKDRAYNVKVLLEVFANATGLQIQWSKSAARWIGVGDQQKPEWVANLTWSWKGKGEATKLLGFDFEVGIDATAILRRCKRRVNDKQKEGGLGLLSVTHQYASFAAKTIRWAFHPGKHPLQALIRGHISLQSQVAFGIPGAQWVYTAAKPKCEGMSAVMENVFQTWESMKKWLQMPQLYTEEDWNSVQIWGTKQLSRDGKVRKVDTVARMALWEEGYRVLGDLRTDNGREIATWEQRKIKGAEMANIRKAFDKLTEQIMVAEEGGELTGRIMRYYEEDSTTKSIWAWQINGVDKWQSQMRPANPNIVTCFKEENSLITHCQREEMLNLEALLRPVEVITCRVGQGKLIRLREEHYPEGAAELAKLSWKNGSYFFAASNSQIRGMLSQNTQVVEAKLRKWTGVAGVNAEDQSRRSRIWQSGRARREGLLLWSICHKCVPTNSWRFPSLPRSDRQRWCSRCSEQVVEDTTHVFWSCAKSAETWRHIQNLFATAQDPEGRWTPKCQHILLGEKLPTKFSGRRLGGPPYGRYGSRETRTASPGRTGTRSKLRAFSGIASVSTSEKNSDNLKERLKQRSRRSSRRAGGLNHPE